MLTNYSPDKMSRTRLLAPLFVVALFLLAASSSGCNLKSKKVSVPPVLTPVVEAETAKLFEEVNRLAAVRSVRGKIDIQFLDTSFAQCGVAEKYRTAEGNLITQREGQIYLGIQAVFGIDVARMTSDGKQFRVAVLQGDERYRRFVRGTNSATYAKLGTNGNAPPDCEGEADKQKSMSVRTVSALSNLRPQHLTDALLLPPVAQPGANFVYARTEAFEEEADTRPKAKKGARVVRAYYLLVELVPEGEGRARVTRRFWFDRVDSIRLARVQTYDAQGQLTTDVVYKEPKKFGAEGAHTLPSQIELTRPQDRYSLRITYQTPEEVKVDQSWPADVFELQNTWTLPETDLDKKGSDE